MSALQKGDKGHAVRALQENLQKLGFTLDVDGDFGTQTHNAIITIQTIFGYDVDGMAGPATHKLIESQVGYGWDLATARKAFKQGGYSGA